MVLDQPVEESCMKRIAREMNLSETAFAVRKSNRISVCFPVVLSPKVSSLSLVFPLGEGQYSLRWFTPTCEVKLCGHATVSNHEWRLRRTGAEILQTKLCIRIIRFPVLCSSLTLLLACNFSCHFHGESMYLSGDFFSHCFRWTYGIPGGWDACHVVSRGTNLAYLAKKLKGFLCEWNWKF